MHFNLPEAESIPYLEQYFGVWAMEDRRFEALADRASNLNISLHVRSQADAEPQSKDTQSFDTIGDLAIIELEGTLMKHVSSFTNGTSTVRARRQVRAASDDPRVAGIMLAIDSPGGTVAGTMELADDVAAANGKKPVVAFIEDLGASAAFWIASQASKIFANEPGLVGSIGTFGVVHDLSGMAAQQGIKVHVIKAGEFKGSGVPGTEITPDMLAESQRVVDDLNELFVSAVSSGRKLSKTAVREMNDGRVHIAAKAEQLRFIDGVKTFDEALDFLKQESRPEHRRKKAMSEAATFKEIKAACLGADSEFICDLLDSGATVEQARDDWMAHQQLKIEELEKRSAIAEVAAKAEANRPGVAAIPEPTRNELRSTRWESEHGGDPVSEWQRVVNELASQFGNDPYARQKATRIANKRHPQLREDCVNAYNSDRGRAADYQRKD